MTSVQHAMMTLFEPGKWEGGHSAIRMPISSNIFCCTSELRPSHRLGINYYVNFLGRLDSNGF